MGINYKGNDLILFSLETKCAFLLIILFQFRRDQYTFTKYILCCDYIYKHEMFFNLKGLRVQGKVVSDVQLNRSF